MMNTEFNKWWNEDLLTEENPFVDNTPAYWAWEGWCAGVKAEREACAKVCDGVQNCGPENGCCPTYWNESLERAAAAIRARSNT
jgi:hypothetical protein